jgi:hypothetical protein
VNTETKQCPECGEEILAVAKKCKHCHSNLGQGIVDDQPIGAFRLSAQGNSAAEVASIDDTDRLHIFSGLFVALVPLSGLLLQYAVGLVGPDSQSLSLVLWVILNSVACSLDSKVLNSAGYDTSALGRWTVLLVPVYLYKRAKVCKPSLLWLWLLCVIAPNMVSTGDLHRLTRGIVAENKTAESRSIRETFKTDKFAITVDAAESSPTVGGGVLGSAAGEGGIYIAIKWSYENISGAPVSAFSVPDIHLVGPDGTKYDPDLGASASYAAEVGTDSKLVSDVNPGIRVKDADVFEVAKDKFDPSTWHVLIDADGDKVSVAFTEKTTPQASQQVVSHGSTAAPPTLPPAPMQVQPPVSPPAEAAATPSGAEGVGQAASAGAPSASSGLVNTSESSTDRSGTASSTTKPSFDCAKASNRVETLICGDVELAKDDSDMSVFYKKILTAATTINPSAMSEIKSGQRAFLSRRNSCAESSCVAETYRARSEELAQMGFVRE